MKWLGEVNVVDKYSKDPREVQTPALRGWPNDEIWRLLQFQRKEWLAKVLETIFIPRLDA
jgi:hypothetical protein